MAVRVNDTLISQQVFQEALASRASEFVVHSSRHVSYSSYGGKLEMSLNPQGQVLARLTEITLNGSPVSGEVFFVQQGGQTMGFRNLFGLAPIPVSSQYQFGGFVNLDILQPTAGREAMSRDSIQHVARLVKMLDAEVSADVADSSAAERNTYFQQYILSHGKIELSKNVTVTVLPSREEVPLGVLKDFEPTKPIHFYAGRKQTSCNDLHLNNRISFISARQILSPLQIQYVRNL